MWRRGKTVSPEAAQHILLLKNYGYSIAKIARRTEKPWTTIKSILNRINDRNSCNIRKNPGRPRKMTIRDTNRLLKLVKTHRRVSTDELVRLFHLYYHKTISKTTIIRSLKRLGIYKRVLKKQVVIRNYNLLKRLKWAKQRLHWTEDQWKTFIFTDESQVVVNKLG